MPRGQVGKECLSGLGTLARLFAKPGGLGGKPSFIESNREECDQVEELLK